MTKVCAIIGIGPGNGRSLVHRFSHEGYRVAMLSRSLDYMKGLEKELPDAHAFQCDATDADAVAQVFKEIHAKLGPVETLVYNAGAGTFKSAEECTLEEFESNWRVNTFGLLLATRTVLEQLREHEHANLVVIGASASLRGRSQTAPFASAKAAQRSLAQSLAKQLGPVHIHVCYLVIDGVIDLPRTREMLPDKPTSFFLNADAIADTVWSLCQQDPSAWTFEVDVRPFGETW